MGDVQGLSSFRDKKFQININMMPMPPSENMSYPTGKHGRRFLSKELALFKSNFQKSFDVFGSEKERIRSQVKEWIDAKLRIEIDIRFYFYKEKLLTKDGRTKKLDTSNRIKAACDAVAIAIGVDDCNFWNVCASKEIAKASSQYCDIILKAFTPLESSDVDTHE